MHGKKGTVFRGRLLWIVSCLLHHTASSHPLVDGNKRLGASLAYVVLWVNRYGVDDDILYRVTVGAAHGDLG